MQYKNKKTGVVINTPCFISGDNWEELKEKVLKKDTKKVDENKKR